MSITRVACLTWIIFLINGGSKQRAYFRKANPSLIFYPKLGKVAKTASILSERRLATSLKELATLSVEGRCLCASNTVI